LKGEERRGEKKKRKKEKVLWFYYSLQKQVVYIRTSCFCKNNKPLNPFTDEGFG